MLYNSHIEKNDFPQVAISSFSSWSFLWHEIVNT